MSSIFQPGGAAPGGPPPIDEATPFTSHVTQTAIPIQDQLRKGTPLHDKVLSRIRRRFDLSRRKIETRYSDWDRVDEFQRLHYDLSRKARKGDKQDTSDGKLEMPFERGVVIPMSKAINDVLVPKMLSLFTHREPPLPIEGSGPEDIRPAKLMETTIAYDCRQMKYVPVLYSLLNDTSRYGMGVLYDTWETEHGWQRPQETPITQFMRMIGIEPAKKWTTTREYNRWSNVDPRRFWPDPRVSMSNIQDAEFCGHRTQRSYSHLLDRSIERGGDYFNLDALKKGGATSGQSRVTGAHETASGVIRSGLGPGGSDIPYTETADQEDRGFFALDSFQIRIIPKEWELGDGEDPIIWNFTMADELVLIEAHESPYDHGRLTYSVGEADPDPHTVFNPGPMELLDGLQRVINWLYNSRIENVKAILNNRLVVASTLVMLRDVVEMEPGGIIRLTPAGEQAVLEGRLPNPQAALGQLNVTDVTGANIQQADMLFQWAQRTFGASDPDMGQPLESKRTLGEIQSILASGNQRIAIRAQLIEANCIAEAARHAIANRQQFMSIEQFFRITGDLAKETQGIERLIIGRNDIQGNFDYLPHTTMAPMDPAREGQLWGMILEVIAKNQILTAPGPDGKALDPREVFNEFARKSGARNIGEFYRQLAPPPGAMPPPGPPAPPGMPVGPPRVVPDAQFAAQVQRGNFVPAPPGPMQ